MAVRKGEDFTAAMAFEIASTNLVIELGVVARFVRTGGGMMLRMMGRRGGVAGRGERARPP